MSVAFESTIFEGLAFFSRDSMVAEGVAAVACEQASVGLVTSNDFKRAVALDRQAWFMMTVKPCNGLPA